MEIWKYGSVEVWKYGNVGIENIVPALNEHCGEHNDVTNACGEHACSMS